MEDLGVWPQSFCELAQSLTRNEEDLSSAGVRGACMSLIDKLLRTDDHIVILEEYAGPISDD